MKHTILKTTIFFFLLALLTTATWALPGDIAHISLSAAGLGGDADSLNALFSANGRFVVFESAAANLVPNDTNNVADIFVYDLDREEISRVSVTSAGEEAHGHSNWPSISGNGRFVVFHSNAPDLVANDTNGVRDIFLHDRETGNTERITVSTNSTSPNGNSFRPTISADGTYIAFYSDASDLVADDDNTVKDIFVYARQTQTMARITTHYDGSLVDGDSMNPVLNENGRYIAYYSWATKLVDDDNNGKRDVFVYDQQTGTTERLSVDSAGNEGNGESLWPAISANGRFVAFQSDATNLVDNDNNGAFDVFVHDRIEQQTQRVSVASDGREANAMSLDPALSANGRFVTFYSWANNLISSDNNSVHDVFAHDLHTGQTIIVSTDSNNSQANGASQTPAITENGRFVAFESTATNLATSDSNTSQDIFIKEIAFPNPTAICDPASPFVNVIIGSDKNDKLIGTDTDDLIIGLAGNDRIEGLAGQDCLIGGSGHDKLYGGADHDTLWGGEVHDAILYASQDRDKLYGDEGNDQLYGGGDQDHIKGGLGDDIAHGNAGRDMIYGNEGDDELYGDADNDVLRGNDGDDFVVGGTGRDHLQGNDGNDTLQGNEDNDKLYGGHGDDDLDGGDGDRDSLEGSRGHDSCVNGERVRGCEA